MSGLRFGLFFEGRFRIKEPGVSLCGCGRHYVPTPCSEGRCEVCRRPKGQNSVDRERIEEERGPREVAELAQFRPRKRALGRGLDALLPGGRT